ncbi:peptidoglycan-binding protein [Mesorhizobium sp. M4A.F.Ca.ET.020.02.1.1]|uniref:peptidoglycan-binding domain-containing protein n=1 Tax=unclassified Mesorhizobium TaxID=325217 RepID=UPI000FCC2574|nr:MULTISPECIES: peptidoglycan-binding protein [unclassified Mesorhizobium]RVD69960.1 peptidoglycan-binding protein [Mesorhizobium sp. M4A.F.Ca.ET.029.04.2.1]RUX44284.1 peptidoglycan-binding protein [Mesorhizobium sp. M4A.F.Ca.ET.050.02.1.1]RVC78264.1 peptidoglycan-binding protein [Mesorhizobium sp. M4A.F.Ca.ET.022.05.2.1]RVD33744.1 peptidoglycan-binding protein [Mesorhizobium sp. M4A.F.Ca.ET.020.02.1.1]RWC22338.1 MAG: peptidoglycan-binding protein [Mesorhizobium sp.]
MARSAKQPRAVKRQSSAFEEGAIALGGMISRNPVLVGGSTAFLVTLFYVSANALWYQPFPHAGAFFATRSIEDFPRAGAEEPETTINIVRPAPVKSDPTVEQVQGILKDLDFYSGTVDGISGPNTRKAIQAYQQKVGLPATGEIDAMLLDQLGAKQTTAAIPHPVPRPVDRATAPAAAPLAAPIPVSAPANVSAEAPDARIVKIQAGLKAFGNNDMQLDGVVGARTKAAIKEFQSLFGLPETGEPDEIVYVKMREIGLTN